MLHLLLVSVDLELLDVDGLLVAEFNVVKEGLGLFWLTAVWCLRIRFKYAFQRSSGTCSRLAALWM